MENKREKKKMSFFPLPSLYLSLKKHNLSAHYRSARHFNQRPMKSVFPALSGGGVEMGAIGSSQAHRWWGMLMGGGETPLAEPARPYLRHYRGLINSTIAAR